MFDIGFWEVAFIGLLALLILGPSRLPEAARSAGQWIGKLRVFISNVKNDLDNQLQSDELEELRQLKNELVQAREVLQQTSGDMISSFTDGLDAQAQEISGLSSLQDSGKPEMDFIDDAVSAPHVSRPKKSKRKSGKPAVLKKGKTKKQPASRKTSTTNKKLTSKKVSKKKTTGRKKASNKKTSSKKIAKAKSRKNGR